MMIVQMIVTAKMSDALIHVQMKIHVVVVHFAMPKIINMFANVLMVLPEVR